MTPRLRLIVFALACFCQIGDYITWVTVGLALFAGAFWATAAG